MLRPNPLRPHAPLNPALPFAAEADPPGSDTDPEPDPAPGTDEGAGDGEGDGEPVGTNLGLQNGIEKLDFGSDIMATPRSGNDRVSIDGERIPVVTNVEVSGGGRESQYLTEEYLDAGSPDEATVDDTADPGTDVGDGGEPPTAGSGEDTQTPPLTVRIDGRMGHNVFERLKGLRDRDEAFAASVTGVPLESMELVDLTRELTGEQPYQYDATVVIREYREVTIKIPTGNYSSPGGQTPTGPGDVPTGVDDTTRAWMGEGSGGVSEPVGEFETVEVPPSPAGKPFRVRVGSGESLTNKLYDISGSGRRIMIDAYGSNWAIKNVGVLGQHPGGHFMVRAGVSDSGGNALIDNLYLGDGQTPRTHGGGLWIHNSPPHNGTITVRRTHISQMVSNGLYGSGPATKGQPGKVDVQNSLFYSNNITNIRLGSKGRTCFVRNCVTAATQSAVPPCGQKCTKPGARRSRGLWMWYGPMRVINSDIHGDTNTRNGGTISYDQSRVGSGAQRRVPKGVPLNARAAAGGNA